MAEGRRRGRDRQSGKLFSYVSAEALVPQGHPLRAMRPLVNAAPDRPSPRFEQRAGRSAMRRVPPLRRGRKIPVARRGAACVRTSAMPLPPPPTPAGRFAGIIGLLCRNVAAQIAGGRPNGPRGLPLAGPLIVVIWNRLRRIGERFARLAARIGAGKLRRRTTRRPGMAPSASRPQRPTPPQPPLPRGFCWLLRLVPETTHGRTQLYHLLADPQMAALIAASPEMGRILRPLCRSLGIPPLPILLPPRPAPAPEPPAPPAAAPPPAAPRNPPATPEPAAPPLWTPIPASPWRPRLRG